MARRFVTLGPPRGRPASRTPRRPTAPAIAKEVDDRASRDCKGGGRPGQPAAHPGARPRPPLPTGPSYSPCPLLSHQSARASTKQSTPGPRPRNRSLSGVNRSPGRRRPVGTPYVHTRSRSPSLTTSLPHLHQLQCIDCVGRKNKIS
jgi:hypothetical protein